MKKYILFLPILFVACTDNARSRSWGGKETVILRENEVLVNATWKETNLWLLTKDTTTGEMFFREKSSYGIFEGEIQFKSK
jgi:hypothetical protein